MIMRCIALNWLRAVLRRNWPAASMYLRLWRECRKPTPF